MEKEIHFCGKVAQKAIIEKEGKVLIMRDVREAEDIWEIPGGRLNEGEIPQEALKREIMEELGVEIKVGSVVNLEQFLQGSEQANALMIAYECQLVDPEAQMVLEEREVAEVRWATKEECESLKFFPEYKNTLDKYFLLK